MPPRESVAPQPVQTCRVHRLDGVRKLPAALATFGLAAFALTGCATSMPSSDACVRPASDPRVAQMATVSGDLGLGVPRVDVAAPLNVAETGFVDLITGSGPRLHASAQAVRLDVALYDAASGDRVANTAFDPAVSQVRTLSDWTTQIPGLEEALACAAGGSRVLVGLDAEGAGASLLQGLGMAVDGSMIAVVDVSDVFLTQAEGTFVFHTDRGLPTVVRAPDGRPGVTVPEVAAPTDLITRVLIEGTGEVVTAYAPFLVNYTGVLWDDGTVFDSSWGNAPATFTLDGLIPGVSEALEGQRVGSQVMVVVPPELGYGDNGSGTVPAGATLVFVFDILGIDSSQAR